MSLITVRRATDYLKTLAHDRDELIPDGSAVVIVGPRQLVDRERVRGGVPRTYSSPSAPMVRVVVGQRKGGDRTSLPNNLEVMSEVSRDLAGLS